MADYTVTTPFRGKENVTWFSFGECCDLWTRHIRFLMDNYSTIHAGGWPTEPIDSGYIGGGRSTRVQTEAKFARHVSLLADAEMRLAKCNSDGHIALGYFRGEFSMDWLIRYEDCPEEDVWRKINRAIAYAGSGPCPRWIACKPCPQYQECHLLKRRRMDEPKYEAECAARGRRPDFLGIDYKTWLIRTDRRRGRES